MKMSCFNCFPLFIKLTVSQWHVPDTQRDGEDRVVDDFFFREQRFVPDIERDGDDRVEDDDVGEEDQQGDGGGSFLHVSCFVRGAGNKTFPGEVNGVLASNQGFPNITGYGHC